MHDLVERDVMVGRDVDGPFFCDVAAYPQRVANRHIGTTVGHLWKSVIVSDNWFAQVHWLHQIFGIDGRWVWYDYRSADVVFICRTINAG